MNGLNPALIITGIKGGYIEEGYSNIISSEAEAKLNFRFPPEHDPHSYLKHFEDFLKENLPSYVTYDWETAIAGKGVTIELPPKLDIDLNQMLKGIYHRKVIYKHVGGSLPIITDFKELLKGVILSLPLANEDSNMHGMNENFDIKYLVKGLEVSNKLLNSKLLENAL
jgi:acetylornithine deacetylase/succinyl-diaminopimelate desuccinylase-like protein